MVLASELGQLCVRQASTRYTIAPAQCYTQSSPDTQWIPQNKSYYLVQNTGHYGLVLVIL